jgi:hypothetical protein
MAAIKLGRSSCNVIIAAYWAAAVTTASSGTQAEGRPPTDLILQAPLLWTARQQSRSSTAIAMLQQAS